ncbi:MAG: tRNA (adenosine(37)-N6)-threonylcarbamoyltransferase complex dimerization subunit type 1 TsaB [Thiotrichales bacterium]
MSRILALDTSTDACSAALLIDETVHSIFEIQPRKHTELILGMVERLLAEAEATLSQLDAIAFGRGPGAFTGVRIATACTQGLASAVDLPVVPVSTLASMAQYVCEKQGGQQMAVCLDARMGEVYAGLFQQGENGLMEPAGDETVCPPQELIVPDWAHWLAVGNGWAVYAEPLEAACSTAPGQQLTGIYPTAKTIATLGAAGFALGAAVPAEQALPVYLRQNVARKKHEQRRSSSKP